MERNRTKTLPGRLREFLATLGENPEWTILHGNSDILVVRLLAPQRGILYHAPYLPEYVTLEAGFSFAEEHGLPSPRILVRSPELRTLMVEDLGTETLQQAIRSGRTELLREAVDLLLQMARLPEEALAAYPALSQRRFQMHALLSEGEYFRRMYIHRYLGRPQENPHLIGAHLLSLCCRLAESPYALMHRDFHSQNLLVLPEAPHVRMIDLQNLCWGPALYDLVSLLRDPYLEIPPELETELREYFFQQHPVFSRWSPANREKLYYLTAIQRHLQTLAAFVYLAQVQGKEEYRNYIPIARQRALEALEKVELFPGLAEILLREPA